MFTRSTKEHGFTIIELLAVIAIIGLLAGVVIASMNSARQKGRIAAGKQSEGSFYHSLGDSLVGQWLFDECSGSTARDSSGNGNDGSFTGTTAWSTDTPFGTGCAGTFTGGASRLTVSNSLGSGAPGFTFSAWVYPSGVIPTWASIASNSSNNGWSDGWGISHYSETESYINFYVGSYTASHTSAIIPLGKWTFISAAYDGTTIRLYVDGKLASSAAYVAVSNFATPPVIGNGGGLAYGWNGNIDNVRIYSRTLDVAEIQKIYALEAQSHGIALVK